MEEISLAETPLPTLPNQPAQAAERPKVQLAKVVSRQLLNSVVTVSVSQLLQMALNLVPFVQALFNQVPALASEDRDPVACGSLREPSSSSAEAVDE
jgi:hypothetical protein